MRLLIDSNLPRSLADRLEASGHEVVDVRDLPVKLLDRSIAGYAAQKKYTLVTRDINFCDDRHYPPVQSLVAVQLPHDAAPDSVIAVVEQFFATPDCAAGLHNKFALVEASRTRFLTPPERAERYSIWLESECWQDPYDPTEESVDVVVTFNDRPHCGSARWAATFVTYKKLASISREHQETGECLSGAYFWADHMLLVDVVSRERIEQVVADLIGSGYFKHVFEQLAES